MTYDDMAAVNEAMRKEVERLQKLARSAINRSLSSQCVPLLHACEVLDACDRILAPQPAVADGWIACSERLPHHTYMVLVTRDRLVQLEACWERGRWMSYGVDNMLVGVTHWREIPVPGLDTGAPVAAAVVIDRLPQ